MLLFNHPPDRFAEALNWPNDFLNTIKKARYYRFLLPKKDGSSRQIEAPSKKLKFLQKTIANALQLFYLSHIPDSVHGYVSGINPTVGTRSILSNAKAHLNAEYLLNLDVDEFFPSIDSIRIMETLRHWFPEMPQETLEMITVTCTKDNHIPMGAPSSPVLSNLCMIDLDRAIEQLAQQHQVVYTRFVDDMTFSAQTAVLNDLEPQLMNLIEEEGFNINKDKRQFYLPDAPKLITGLVIHNKEISVQKELLDNIQKCIKEYDKLKWLQRQMESDKKWLHYKTKAMEQSIKGQLAFLQQIKGNEDSDYLRLKKQLKKAKKRLPPSFDFYF